MRSQLGLSAGRSLQKPARSQILSSCWNKILFKDLYVILYNVCTEQLCSIGLMLSFPRRGEFFFEKSSRMCVHPRGRYGGAESSHSSNPHRPHGPDPRDNGSKSGIGLIPIAHQIPSVDEFSREFNPLVHLAAEDFPLAETKPSDAFAEIKPFDAFAD